MSTIEQSRALARREANRRRLLRFTEHTFPGYRSNFHHENICLALEAVARYELPRVIIVAPPRHGKSELVSRRFPAWYLANSPHRQIIGATYGQSLSDRMSRDVKSIIDKDEFRELFPDFDYGSLNRVAEWSLDKDGTYKNVGAGGPVTGFGGNIILIDDPEKNREEAESEVIRKRKWEWFNNDIMTRLEAPGAVVLMATRWHEDDLIGRVLNSATADQWVVLHYPRVQDVEPTEADPRPIGAPLWPGRLMNPWEICPELAAWPHNAAEALEAAAYEKLNDEDDELALATIRPAARVFRPSDYSDSDPFLLDDPDIADEDRKPVTLARLVARDLAAYETFNTNDPYGASALEQGRPTPRAGSLIDADAINTYMGTPAERGAHCSSLLISIDANFKKTRTSDRASMTVFGHTSRPNAIYLLDERVGRFSYPQLKRRAKELAAIWPRATIMIEAKANGQALIDDLRDEGYARVVGYDPEKHGSKEVRMQFAAEYIAGGGLFVPTPAHAPFVLPWLEEVTKYGQAPHDDRADSFAMATRHWASHNSGLAHLRRIVGNTHVG